MVASGPGLADSGIQCGHQTYFTVDARQCGKASCEVLIMDGKNKVVPVTVMSSGENIYQCQYKPVTVGRHAVFISYGGANITHSPYVVSYC